MQECNSQKILTRRKFGFYDIKISNGYQKCRILSESIFRLSTPRFSVVKFVGHQSHCFVKLAKKVPKLLENPCLCPDQPTEFPSKYAK